MELQQLAVRFHALFAGLERGHGTYNNIDNTRDDGKRTGKAVTLRQPVTDELWLSHLAGRSGIGIVPIRDDNTVVFGAIDIDVYADLDPARVAGTLSRLRMPLVVCRSKSGGVHSYLFTKEPVAACTMQDKLRDIAAMLGFGGSEIFPKQKRLFVERDEVGGWINMPYFDAANTTRYAVNAAGDALTVGEFLALADRLKVDAAFFDAAATQTPEPLPGGPPCLQHLCTQGFPAGTRNSGLFALGVYARKSNPDGWGTDLEGFNHRFMQPPLGHQEVGDVVKSVSKKTYRYPCDKHPLAPHCNVGVCKTRAHGIGGAGESMPVLGALTKIDSKPPTWLWDADGERIELTTDELMDFSKFQRACLDRLNKMLPDLTAKQWKAVVAKALETLHVEPVGEDASPEGQFWELLENFCNGRAQAHTRDELLLGKPYTDGEEARTYFKLTDLLGYLDRRRFKMFTTLQKVCAVLKARGGTDHQWKVRGKCCRVWSVAAFPRDSGGFDLPPSLTDDVAF